MSPRPGSSAPPPTALVPVGSYGLEVGYAEGTFALFAAQAEEANASRLAQALSAKAEAEAARTADLVEGPLDEASSVTACSERCLGLFNAIAAGNALDPKVVSSELDAALALLARLDRSGRHKEVLRLARDLCALFALLLRWLELVRTLRLALTTAHALGDRSTEAWALHELGSLYLAAGQSKTAAEYLHQALKLQQELAGYGRCATRHNLDAAERDTTGHEARHKARRRRRLRFVGASVLIAFLASGGVALGVTGAHRPRRSASPPAQSHSTTPTRPTTPTHPTTPTQPTTPIQPTTPTQPTTSTQPTTPTRPNTVDKTKPSLELTAPAANSYLTTQTPTFSGTGGLAAGDLATITLTVYPGANASGAPMEQRTAQRDLVTGAFSVLAQPSLAEGTYTVVATQRDQHGNVGIKNVSFTIDVTKPIVSFTSSSQDLEDPTPTFQGTAGTAPGDDPTIAIKVYLNEATPSATPVEVLKTSAVDGTWKADSTTSLQEGSQYQAVVSQSDEAGNTGSDTVSFEVPPQ